jgi:hypothetical protein
MDPMWFERVLGRVRVAVRSRPRVGTRDVIVLPESDVVDTSSPLRSVELIDG